MIVAALLVALAGIVVLWPLPEPQRRLSRLTGHAGERNGSAWDPWKAVWAGPVAAAILFGPAPALAALMVAGLVARQRRRARIAAAAERDVGDVIAALAVMGAELSVGAPVVQACRVAAAELVSAGGGGPVGAELSRLAARAELGGDPGAALSEAQVVRRLAEAWATSLQHGLPIGDMLAALRSDLVARQDFAARTRAGLAGPRATAGVLAGLPLLGILLGEAMGAGPVGVLLNSSLGGILLVIGTGLSVGGVLWAGRITDRAVSG
ncbi:type II secretion system F family protein [Gordonia hydrophobica]|uniref:Type II secretion system F family protein n=1 Tax=Gordonia hydrophobica TaxID=40516 RepID=A0ABZ2U577_9ACTN|nr:type II secretion system F family protein [Gordonia hydrophobica]MBM7368124.1 tight adherence protein B [Gordonia hydrophobica]